MHSWNDRIAFGAPAASSYYYSLSPEQAAFKETTNALSNQAAKEFFPAYAMAVTPLRFVGVLGKAAVGIFGKAGAVSAGTKVFRVWGDGAGAWGRSWTTVDPRTVSNFRNAAGLPNQNTGRFLSEGVLHNAQGVTARGARPLHGNAGGLTEFVVPNPKSQILLRNVQGLNPGF